MFFILVLTVASIEATYVISLYGDVYNDITFFTRTYPWIIDNIGGDIMVDYYLLGSGRYSVPQMCALNEMKMNNFLQAQFLKCEAEGNPSEICLCESGINPQNYKHCVLTKGNYASRAVAKYSQIGIEASPIIEIGYRNTIFEVDDTWYLKKICSIFGDNLPRGCIKPFACDNETKVETGRKGVVNFDCANCLKLDVTVVDSNTSSRNTSSTTLTSPTTTTISTSLLPPSLSTTVDHVTESSSTTDSMSTLPDSTSLYPTRRGPRRGIKFEPDRRGENLNE